MICLLKKNKMIAILSPAKTIRQDSDANVINGSVNYFLDDAEFLINILRTKSKQEISELLKISGKLLEDNYSRIHEWEKSLNAEAGYPAILSYKGEVYNGLKAQNLSKSDLEYSQNCLKIISGLYGVLRPLDLIKPYRLEMGSKLKLNDYINLYKYWGVRIHKYLENELERHYDKTLINLASNEYYKTIDNKVFKHNILNIEFKDYRHGYEEPKIVTIYAKKARGEMAAFIVKNRIESKNDLKAFDGMGYNYDAKFSDNNNYFYTR